MKKICFIALFALAVVPAIAQQASQPIQQSTPFEQALAAKLNQEINNNLQCTAQVVTLQQQIQKLEAELKALKETPAKPEAKK